MKNDKVRYLTPPNIAARLRASPEKVRGWIRKAELRAVNVGAGASRPHYRINPDDFEDLLTCREAPPPPPRIARRRAHSQQGAARPLA